jgi:transmembrane sensor
MDQEQLFILWARYLAGEAGMEEREELERAFQADPGLRRLAALLSGMHQSPSEGMSADDEEQLLKRGLERFKAPPMRSLPVMKRISFEDAATASLPPIAAVIAKGTAPVRRTRLFFLVAAASVLVLIGGVVLYLHMGKQLPPVSTAVAAPRGAKKFIQLADGSKLWLNAGSSVEFPSGFSSANRAMTLEGEAFLEVQHDEEHPFVIHTGRLDVRVLGTALNVRAYPGDSTVETTLINGRAEVDIPGDARPAIILHPNEKLTVAIGRRSPAAKSRDSVAAGQGPRAAVTFYRRPIEPDRTDGTITETSWVSNKLVFRQETLAGMAIRLERWYDVTIIFDNQQFRNDTLSGTFPQEPIGDVMHALQITAGFHYRINKDTVRIW